MQKIIVGFFLFFLSLLIFTGSALAKSYYYKFDYKNSEITFYFATTLHPVNGIVKEFYGYIELKADENNNISKADGILKITAGSLDTNQKQRDSRMYSETLSIKSYPLITFKVNDVKVTGNNLEKDGSMYMRLLGDLTIRDISRPVSIPVKVLVSDDKSTAMIQGRYNVNFKDFKVPDPSLPLIGQVEDMINISFKINAY